MRRLKVLKDLLSVTALDNDEYNGQMEKKGQDAEMNRSNILSNTASYSIDSSWWDEDSDAMADAEGIQQYE